MIKIISSFLLLIFAMTTLSIVIISTAEYLTNTITIDWFEAIVISAIWYKIFATRLDEMIKSE